MNLALALLALLGLAAQASAQTLTALGTDRDQRVSRVWMVGDAPLKYQVELADPQTVVVHLTGTRLGAKAAQPDPADPTIASLEVKPEKDGLAVVVKTKAPGITVLPFYEAATRRLTVELGGSPSLRVDVKPEAAAAKQPAKPKATPAAKPPAPQPAPAARPGPVAQAAPAKPKPKARPKPQGPPPRIRAIRLGTHPDYTRLVLDGNAVLHGGIIRQGQKAILKLRRGGLVKGAQIDSPDKRVLGIKVLRARPLVLELDLSSPMIWHRKFGIDSDRSLVVDLMLSGKPLKPTAKAEPEPKPEAKTQPRPVAAAAKPAPPTTVTMKMPAVTEPPATQPKKAPPTTVTQAAPPAMPPAPAAPAIRPPALPSPRPAPAATPPVKAAAPAPRPGPPAAPADTLPMALPASKALLSPGRAHHARGMIPALDPPEPLARTTEPSPHKVRGVIGAPEDDDPTLDRVMAKVVKASREGGPQALVRGAIPPPDQGAAQDDKVRLKKPDAEKPGLQKGRAEALYARSKKELERRNYSLALRGFEAFVASYPDHRLAGEALFRLADAYFHVHQRDMLQKFDQVMKHYQRAITHSPRSGQVPWAMLMMGRASLLNQEPHRALGYFKLVSEDYPKSEYVPLALTNIARTYMRLGKPLEALEQFRAVASRFPDSRFRDDAEYGQVQALFALARYRQASEHLKRMLARRPDLHIKDPEMLFYSGEAEFQQKKYDEARRYYLWALNIRPDIRDADIILTRVGDTFQFDRNPKAARVIYQQVIDGFPGKDGALVARIRLAEQTQSAGGEHPWSAFRVTPTRKALLTYLDIMDNFPDREVAQLAAVKLGVYYYKTKEYPKAIATLSQLLTDHPTSPYINQVRYTLDLSAMGMLAELKKQGKPLALMDSFLQHRRFIAQPNSTQVLRLMAWAYEQSGLNRRAAKLYEVLVSRDLKDPSLTLAWARNLYPLRDYQGVIKALGDPQAAGLKGADVDLAASLKGRALAHLGKYAQARDLLAPLAKAKKAGADDYQWLGTAYSRLGQTEAALTALETAEKMLAQAKAPALVRYLVAMEYAGAAKKAGMWAEAATAYRRALTLAAKGQDKAAALYGLAQSLRGLKKHQEVADTFGRLKELGVLPWSQMAERHLADMELAPRLASVGK